MTIHDVKDDPILQVSSQEPSMSSKYGLGVWEVLETLLIMQNLKLSPPVKDARLTLLVLFIRTEDVEIAEAEPGWRTAFLLENPAVELVLRPSVEVEGLEIGVPLDLVRETSRAVSVDRGTGGVN